MKYINLTQTNGKILTLYISKYKDLALEQTDYNNEKVTLVHTSVGRFFVKEPIGVIKSRLKNHVFEDNHEK